MAARRILELVVQEFEALAPKAVERLEAGFEDAMAVMALPEPIRRRLRTTNALERLNREIRRRERVKSDSVRKIPLVEFAAR